ncbi:formyltetrahydrofolate deformylase [Myxococcota bacterium]|nr:formyltetrahydrofolate deformylase [Myxococcota bacterium]
MTNATGPKTSTLLVSCPDQRGLVARLAQLLYSHGANILDADQHTDAEAGIFFQRIRFDHDDLEGDLSLLENSLAEISAELDLTFQLSDDTRTKRVAVFVSRDDHCLYDLLLRHRAGELVCEIPLIVSNHPRLEPVAQQFGVPFHVFPITAETKAEQERAEIALLEEHDIDLVVLARYMQILSENFIAHFPAQIINIHHSFLPAFSGGRPYHQAHTRGVKLIGATAHYATADLDEGPIIEQDVIRSSHRDSVSELTRKGRDVERMVLSRGVRWHLEDRILIYGNKTVVFA